MLHTNENMGNKEITVAARFSEDEAEVIKDVAETLDVPQSQIIREAVRREVARLNRTHPKLKNRLEPEAA